MKTQEQFNLFGELISKPSYLLPTNQPSKPELNQINLLIKSGKTTRINKGKTYCIVKGRKERDNWQYTIQITDEVSSRLIEHTPIL